jgi:DNA-binding NarL/FixJ family response regulator
VLKQICGNDLVDGVRRVAAGQSLLDPPVTQRVLERIRNGVEQPRDLASLTDQERRILEHVAEGLTNREIAAQMFFAEKTVKNYVSSLPAKLGHPADRRASPLLTRGGTLVPSGRAMQPARRSGQGTTVMDVNR